MRTRAKEKDGSKGVIRYLMPEGNACRAPPTYKNLFWAAGWSPRTGNTSESKPSSETCSPHVLKKRIY